MSTELTSEALDTLFRKARTYRSYQGRPVFESQLRQIWDLVKFGPTSANLMPARFVWCVSETAKDRLATFASDANVDNIRKAPVAVIVAMDMKFYEQGPRLFPYADVRAWFEGNEIATTETALRNSSLQGAYFILGARALGLDTGPMSGFDAAAVDEAFFAGTTYKSNFISTLGYGDPATLFDRLPRPDFEDFNSIV